MVCDFRNFFWTHSGNKLLYGVHVPLYQDNSKLGQSDKRERNDLGDNDPEKVTKLNMKYGLVLYIAIYIYIYIEDNDKGDQKTIDSQ